MWYPLGTSIILVIGSIVIVLPSNGTLKYAPLCNLLEEMSENKIRKIIPLKSDRLFHKKNVHLTNSPKLR